MIILLILIILILETISLNLNHSYSVINCCGLNNHLELIKCVNVSSINNKHHIEHYISMGGGPSLGIGIVTYSTSDIFDYSSYSFAVNEAFAEHNGYILKLIDNLNTNDDIYDKDDPRWNKVKILEMAIDPVSGWAKDLDYVMWIDADLIFLDMNLRIEQIAASYPKAHILISAENHGSTTLVNSGSILIKNSKWSKKFLSSWWSWSSRKHYSDQEQFDMLYHARRKEDRLDEYIAVLPPDAINSDPPASTNQKDHNQVLHLMGEHSGFRIKTFGSAFNEICRHVNQSRTTKFIETPSVLASQLTASRSNMLEWTLEEYGKEYIELIKTYSDGAPLGIFGISESRKLSNSIHHYAHALTIIGTEEDKHLATSLRMNVFQLLTTNMEARRPKNEQSKRLTGRSMSDWPELLKLVAESGQHLLSLGSIGERRNVSSSLISILDEIYDAVHINQKNTVLLMRASIYRDIALIELSDGNLELALENFEYDLTLSTQLAKLQGEHILMNPYSMTANTLAMMGRFEEAIKRFDKTIELSINHFGDKHESLSQHFLNKGITLHNLGNDNNDENDNNNYKYNIIRFIR